MSNKNAVYLIPKDVPCPNCGYGVTTVDILFISSPIYKCPFCNVSLPAKEWLGKRVGKIENVRD